VTHAGSVVFYTKKVQILLANVILKRKQVLAKKRYVYFQNTYIVLTTPVFQVPLVYIYWHTARLDLSSSLRYARSTQTKSGNKEATLYSSYKETEP